MRFAAALALLLIPLTGLAQEKIDAEIPTHSLKPSQVMHLVTAGRAAASTSSAPTSLPPGIDTAFAADGRMVIVVHGRADAVNRMREMVKLLDVAPRAIWVKARILKFSFRADGSWDVDVVGQPEIKTLNSVPASIAVSGQGGYTLKVDPSIISGGVAVRGDLVIAGTPERQFAFTKRIAVGHRAVVGGYTDSPNPEIQKSVEAGRIPLFASEHVAYYLQITPSLESMKK